MKELKLNKKQNEILENLYKSQSTLQTKLNEINTQINLSITLILDSKKIENANKVNYHDGIIEYEEGDEINGKANSRK